MHGMNLLSRQVGNDDQNLYTLLRFTQKLQGSTGPLAERSTFRSEISINPEIMFHNLCSLTNNDAKKATADDSKITPN